jgi:DNA-binding transcriptional LysR family regulator
VFGQHGHRLAQHLGSRKRHPIGQLVEVLADFAAPPNGIYGVFPQRKHLPLRLRLWIDFLKHHYSLPATWQSAP